MATALTTFGWRDTITGAEPEPRRGRSLTRAADVAAALGWTLDQLVAYVSEHVPDLVTEGFGGEWFLPSGTAAAIAKATGQQKGAGDGQA